MSSCTIGGMRCGAICFLLVSSSLVSFCNGYVNWLYPGAGLTFNYIDTVYFTWTSDIMKPWMNLWCAPNSTAPQSKTQAYHARMSSKNGTNPQSFPYSDYYNNGICHMQLENLAEDNFGNTPTFEITSNDAVAPHTWGLSALSLLGEAARSTAMASTSSSPASPRSSSTPVETAIPSTSSSLLASSSASLSLPSSITSSTNTAAASTTTTKPATPRASAPPPSQTLSTAAKAGIGIGSTFSGVALIIAVLLFRIIRSRRTNIDKNDPNGAWPSGPNDVPHTHDIDDGAYYEIGGVARPTELQGMSRAELDSAHRIELNSVAER